MLQFRQMAHKDCIFGYSDLFYLLKMCVCSNSSTYFHLPCGDPFFFFFPLLFSVAGSNQLSKKKKKKLQLIWGIFITSELWNVWNAVWAFSVEWNHSSRLLPLEFVGFFYQNRYWNILQAGLWQDSVWLLCAHLQRRDFFKAQNTRTHVNNPIQICAVQSLFSM